MVHENMAINDANIDMMQDYLVNISGGSAAVDDTSAQLAAAVTIRTNFTSHVSDTPSARVSSTIINNNSITPGSSMKIPKTSSLRDNITPPKRFVARPSNFGISRDDKDRDKELETNEYPDNVYQTNKVLLLHTVNKRHQTKVHCPRMNL